MKVSLKDAFKIRRVYRRLERRKGTGSLQRMTVFIQYENVVRLLEFLGYCREYPRESLRASSSQRINLS
jgi:hypothetical protein